MKIFHTADWHLGKILQGVHLTEEQAIVLADFMRQVKEEKPDCIIIAGDIYDRAIPPPEAVQLLNDTLNEIIIDLQVPVLAIAGNHDSPSRLHFGSSMMAEKGLHLIGQFNKQSEPVILHDRHGEVHFHLIPYMEPSTVRHIFQDEEILSHDDAMKAIVEHLTTKMDANARHVLIGHAFVTPYGEKEENTSDSEKPLSIGGAEYVDAGHFEPFHYTALGHLHQAHFVKEEKIRFAGSPYKYSISEENHQKGFYIVNLDEQGETTIEKRLLKPGKDVRSIKASMDEMMEMDVNEDYVFVTLTDETPVLAPMEKIRTVFPNAMHVEREFMELHMLQNDSKRKQSRTEMSDKELFEAFYKEVNGKEPSAKTTEIFKDLLETFMQQSREM